MKILNRIKCFLQIDWCKTLYINYIYGGGKKLPIYIYRHCKLKSCKGKVIFPPTISRGLIRIGEHCLGHVDRQSTPTIWNVEDGIVEFKGCCFLNQGTKLNVGKGASIIFGNHVTCTGDSEFLCNHHIEIGDYSLLSWDILLLDSDQHKIIDSTNKVINNARPIIIGEHVWIGCRTTILKGANIPANSIIASGSIIAKSLTNSHSIISSSGGEIRVLKEEIDWRP